MAGRLAEKVCVITGTGGSMGRAAALTFAREGALVVGCDVAVEPAEETVALVQAAGGQMVSLQPCRVSEPDECDRLVELAIGSFGRIDVLYNLAARSRISTGWRTSATKTGRRHAATRSIWCSTSPAQHGPTSRPATAWS